MAEPITPEVRAVAEELKAVLWEDPQDMWTNYVPLARRAIAALDRARALERTHDDGEVK